MELRSKRPEVFHSTDPVRTISVFLALCRIQKEEIPGAIAELGVYKGELSYVLHRTAPERRLLLFDTFEGFTATDSEGQTDERFRDTSLEMVRRRLEGTSDLRNVEFRKGWFPDSAKGLEDERFAFVMIDVDKYPATRTGLQFFYPRLNSGGYLFVHDYNSPESNWGVSRALEEFLPGKTERVIELADQFGSVVLRKC